MVTPEAQQGRASGDGGGGSGSGHEELRVEDRGPPLQPASGVTAQRHQSSELRLTAVASLIAGGIPIRWLEVRLGLRTVRRPVIVRVHFLGGEELALRKPKMTNSPNLACQSAAGGFVIVLRVESPSLGEENRLVQQGRGHGAER